MNRVIPNDITQDDRFYVEELQRYLQAIQRQEQGTASLSADGFYDPATTDAVRAFQQKNGIPVTGITDEETWNAIRDAAETAAHTQTAPVPVDAYPTHQPPLTVGDASACVAILQVMLRSLSARYENLPAADSPSGVYDPNTARMIRSIQRLTGIPENGIVDRLTWDAVAMLYNKMS